jgi:voltage-gated potassium channel Kch
LFRSVARQPELILVGALAWCFLVAGLASALGLSREMGALIAGVALSTFPYTLDVAARVNTLRDFFVTLFFVSLGMQIPAPNLTMLLNALLLAAVVVVSRQLTVFPPLFALRTGIRGSALPTINLSQISEFSLVIVALGSDYQHIGQQTTGIILYAFVITAVFSSYAIIRSEELLRIGKPVLRWLGLRDLDETTPIVAEGGSGHAPASVYLLGFSWTASSLLEEITRHSPELLQRLAIIDFNPLVNHELRQRGVRIIYGDITQRDTLVHAGVAQAEVLVCTLPNTVLKGSSNLRLARELRAINPNAKLIVHAEKLQDVPELYAAGADYVSVPRLIEAEHLSHIVWAACEHRIAEARTVLDDRLRDRHEVIP